MAAARAPCCGPCSASSSRSPGACSGTGASISYVPQRERIERVIPVTAFEVVLMGPGAKTRALQRIGRAEREAADRALALLGLESLGQTVFRNLSTGQQQRVLLARAHLLFGNVLAVQPAGAVALAIIALLVVSMQALFGRRFLLVTFDPEAATVAGVNTGRWCGSSWSSRTSISGRPMPSLARPARGCWWRARRSAGWRKPRISSRCSTKTSTCSSRQPERRAARERAIGDRSWCTSPAASIDGVMSGS
jgi:hypothetical protein